MKQLFQLERWRVIVSGDPEGTRADATVKIKVGDQEVHTADVGSGPVDALSNALRKALEGFYPEIHEVKLVDYIVNIENSDLGTAAKVKVLIEMQRDEKNCRPKSISANIIEASWNALTEGLSELLLKGGRK